MAETAMPGRNTTASSSAAPVERMRYDTRIRTLAVVGIEAVTPAMLRVTFGGDDLGDFDSRGFDDHVKLLLSQPDGSLERRDYSLRRFDRKAGTLAIDFALHDAGPATSWARQARPGDCLEAAGPRGSKVVSSDVRRWMLIGDETALPAIGRLHEEAAPDAEITSLVAVVGEEERQAFVTAGTAMVRWVHRPSTAASDPAALLAALAEFAIEPETFVWVAAEGAVARAIRERLIARGHPRGWMKVSGYWIAGRADAHLKLD